MTKKVKVERKPMKTKRTRKISEEQREALRERMKDMRKKRKPAEYKNVNERVLVLPDDDTYSFKNVKGWIKHNKEMVAALGKQGRGRHAGEKEQRIAEMQAASRVAMAYYPDGTPKRSVGVFYPDINIVWTNKMELEGEAIEMIKRHRSTTKTAALTDKQFTGEV